MYRFIYSLIGELGCNKKESRFENTQTGCNRYGIKILDSQCLHFLFFVLDSDFE